jgi:glycine/D-amino acid oxidase-like deaminating enzyme
VRAGAELHRSGTLAPFRRTGGFRVGEGLGDEDVSLHVPIARGRGVFQPDDGVVDVARLLATFLSGARVRTEAAVAAIERHRDELRVVLASGESIRARVVVNAAGAWAGVLGGLPLEPRKRHVFLSTPRQAPESWPWTWDEDAGLYFRSERGALLLCGCDERAGEPGDNAVEPAAQDELLAKVERFQPGLLPLGIATSWAGQRTFAPDGRFVIGWDPRVDGLFWVAGLGGHGVTASPAIGAFAADLIARGPSHPPRSAELLSPARLVG